MSATINNVFPSEISNEIYDRVQGHSTIAKLSGQKPLSFTGTDYFVLNLDNEANIVAENAPKSNGGATVGTINVKPIKFEYGFRASDEFKYADDEYRAGILAEFGNAIARKFARALDIASIHGINPRTGAVSPAITSSFDTDVQNVVQASDNAYTDLQAASGLVSNADGMVNGLALSPAMLSDLATLTNANGNPLFPEIGLGTNIDTFQGVNADVNATVSFNDSLDKAVIGDFENAFRWGVAKEIPYRVIEWGDPDNSGDDLAGHNQVYLRAETYLGWGIFDAEKFAIVKNTEN
jgi:HK97 family phage major capsid protein